MPGLWNTYTGVLGLYSETFAAVKRSQDGLWLALKLCLIVGLIAGLGKWLGVRTTWAGLEWVQDLPTVTEQVRATSKSMVHLSAQILSTAVTLPYPPLQQLLFAFSDFLQTGVTDLLANLETELAELVPPIGERPSRIVYQAGDWLSTPFEWMAEGLLFSLIILLFAKLMGGTGTLTEHLSLTALAVAPLVLTFFHHIPVDAPLVGFALGIFSRTLNLIIWPWTALILIKAIAIGHELSVWRAIATLVVAYVVVYVLMPLLFIAAVGYVLLSGST